MIFGNGRRLQAARGSFARRRAGPGGPAAARRQRASAGPGGGRFGGLGGACAAGGGAPGAPAQAWRPAPPYLLQLSGGEEDGLLQRVQGGVEQGFALRQIGPLLDAKSVV